MRSVTWPLLGMALVLAGCGGSEDEGVNDVGAESVAATTQAPASTAPASTVVVSPPDSEERTALVGGGDRSYLLFLPSVLDPAVPAPLVLGLHGKSERGRSQEYHSGFNELAEREGVVVVYPDAVGGSWDMAGTNDVEFIAAIIDEVSAATAIDPGRVYLAGFSQGGAFSTFLACHLPDRITAIASVATLLHHDAPGCPAHSPARILTFAGETDRIVSIEEGLLISSPDPDPPGPLADEIGAWTATNGCDSEPDEESLTEGLVRSEYDCASGSALVVYIHPGGHFWPRGEYGLETTEIIWEFFEQYAAPLPTG